jgi:hypothetical protein
MEPGVGSCQRSSPLGASVGSWLLRPGSAGGVRAAASAASSTCTLSIGVPFSPAFHSQRLLVLFKEEGTSRPRSGGASTSSGYVSRPLRSHLSSVRKFCGARGRSSMAPNSTRLRKRSGLSVATKKGSGHGQWLVLSVSHSGSVGAIRQGEFIAHFDQRYPVKRVVSFVTPKGSLPDLLGPTDELSVAKERSPTVVHLRHLLVAESGHEASRLLDDGHTKSVQERWSSTASND